MGVLLVIGAGTFLAIPYVLRPAANIPIGAVAQQGTEIQLIAPKIRNWLDRDRGYHVVIAPVPGGSLTQLRGRILDQAGTEAGCLQLHNKSEPSNWLSDKGLDGYIGAWGVPLQPGGRYAIVLDTIEPNGAVSVWLNAP